MRTRLLLLCCLVLMMMTGCAGASKAPPGYAGGGNYGPAPTNAKSESYGYEIGRAHV